MDGVELEPRRHPSSTRDDDKVSVWGVTEGNSHLWDRLEEGNYLLFYVGDYKYEYVAEVTGTVKDPDLAEELWPDYEPGETGGNDPGDPWDYIIFLDSPIRVDIDSEEIHTFAGHKSNYPQRFMPLNDQAHQAIRNQFGSLEDYFDSRIPSHADEKGLRSETDNETEPPAESGNDASDSRIGSSDRASSKVDRGERASDLRPPDRTETTVSRIIRNTGLAKELKEQYNHQCQVCGEYRKRTPMDRYAEAHHIQPLGGTPPGPDVAANILVLCPNHHSDFDYGLIEVDPDTLTIQHGYDDSIDGSKLQVRDEHTLDSDYLEYHNEELSKL